MRFGAGITAGQESALSGYTLGNDDLRLVRSHKDLGVMVDSSLKFHCHINNICRKASGLANQLLRCVVCRDPDFMVQLFVSHIRPLLEYCSTVWNLGYIGDVQKLEAVQRRWTKQVSGLYDTEYSARLRSLNLYSVRGRLLRIDLVKLWKVFHTEIEDEVGLLSMLDRHSHASTRGHCFKLAVPRCRTDLKKRFFNVRCVDVWNRLPESVVDASSVNAFKKRLGECIPEQLFSIGA